MSQTTQPPANDSEKRDGPKSPQGGKKGWIRWPGLIAFVAITLILAVVWHFLADWLVKRAVESAGTRAVGAKVEVAAADLSLFPAGLVLDGLQVTNPDAPMTNAVEIGRVGMDLELAQLIRRRVVVNLMQVDALRFNTERKSSGALPDKQRRKEGADSEGAGEALKKGLEKMGCGNFKLPSFEKPDLQNLLANEQLKSLELAQQLEADIKAEEAYWQKTLKELPDQQTLKAYEEKLKGLSSKKSDLGALLGKAGDALTVQKELRADLERIKAAQQRFQKSSRDLRQRVQQLPKAPMADVRRLQAKYSLSADGLANLSQLLIGGQLCDHWQTAWEWYQRLKPYIAQATAGGEAAAPEPERGTGAYVRFTEKTPLPTFLIRQTKASVQLPLGALSGKIENINSNPPLLGKPTAFNFLGRDLAAAKSLSATGLIDLVTPGDPSSRAKLELNGYQLDKVPLSREAALPVTVDTALADLAADFSFAEQRVNTSVDMDFDAVKLSAAAPAGDNAVQTALINGLTGIRRFDLVASVMGNVDDYRMKIRSSLDQTLKDAVGGLVKKEAAKLSAQIESKVRQAVSAPLSNAQQQIDVLGPVGDELQKRLNIGGELLKGSGLKLPF
ncbi:MAG: TIGR03545 family protein [Desulfosarcinaceae bacterium]|nr:TIGR03545 family protein [Desulfosarcinaceae bacterium]